MIWGAFWGGGRSEINIMKRDEAVAKKGYTKHS
jgi:hypothetical protein